MTCVSHTMRCCRARAILPVSLKARMLRLKDGDRWLLPHSTPKPNDTALANLQRFDDLPTQY